MSKTQSSSAGAPWPFHFLAIALYPFVQLLAVNLGTVRTLDVVIAAGIALAVASVAYPVLGFVMRDRAKGAVLLSVCLLLFFSFGHVHGALRESELTVGGVLLGRQRYLLPACAAIVVITFVLLLRARRMQGVTRLLNGASAIFLGIALLSVGAGLVRSAAEPSPASVVEAELPAGRSAPSTGQPDIYYILLDGYASQYALEKFYDFSNSEFVDFLVESGFHVVPAARSNYASTALSMASVLSMDHVAQLYSLYDNDLSIERTCHEKIRENRAAQFLKSQGYRYALVGSGWGAVSGSPIADENHQCGASNEVFGYLVDTTMLRMFPFDRRDLVLCAFETLVSLRGSDEPLFVYAHISSPHPPFVFNADGSARRSALIGMYSGGWEKDAYLGQLKYLNTLVMSTIRELMEDRDRPPVIIVQGDHGPQANDQETQFDDWVDERLTILNAYLVPDEVESRLYPGITPVNSFRTLFNGLFDAGFDRVEDTTYVTRGGVRDVSAMLPAAAQAP